ncbi:MAG: magnesium transporter CorA family protein [Patescibacteria group bacterium]|nr:magnesium transporter CorA family protein [Patescibacteria group bacterium]
MKYTKISKNIQKVIIDNPITPNDKLVWINISNAGKKEIEYLHKNYDFDLLHLQASSGKSISQRPKIIQEKSYSFMILHFPVFRSIVFENNKRWKKGKKENTKYNIVAGEIDFFIGHGYLITLHNNNIKVLNEFFNLCKKDGNSLLAYEFESSAVLLYELLERLLQSCFYLLDQNSIEISKVEKIIFEQKQKRAVSQILLIKRNVINFRKIIQNHKNIIKKLMKMKSELVPEEKIKKYYNKLLEHSKRIWEILENQKEMIEALDNTNESLLNYRISDIMKTLTIFSVIVFPLSLLAGIFGMNTSSMPFVNNENGFWIIIIIMLIGCLGMLVFFERKKWL